MCLYTLRLNNTENYELLPHTLHLDDDDVVGGMSMTVKSKSYLIHRHTECWVCLCVCMWTTGLNKCMHTTYIFALFFVQDADIYKENVSAALASIYG